MKTLRWNWLLLFGTLSLSVGFFGCKSPQVKDEKKDLVEGGGGTPQVQRGCIKGRVTNEEGKGFAGVFVNTKPTTSPEVTDSSGFFEICNRRVIKNAETGETSKEPLQDGAYVLEVNKDGYHARPFNFDYKGSLVKLEDLVMVEKSKPLPAVVETKQGEEKRSATGGGKSPTGE